MKTLIVAALAALGLAGCVAVPYGGDPYYDPYYAAPSVGVGVGFYSGHGHHRHRHYHRRHWRR
jgi:hypothetical protein